MTAFVLGCQGQRTAAGAARVMSEVRNGVRTMPGTYDETRVARILQQSRELNQLPESSFTRLDLEQRSDLMRQVDAIAMRAVDVWASEWARTSYTTLRHSADEANRLADTWTRDGIARVVNWATWVSDVQESGNQVIAAVGANPQPYVRLVRHPPVQRAAVAYAKLCYGPPR